MYILKYIYLYILFNVYSYIYSVRYNDSYRVTHWTSKSELWNSYDYPHFIEEEYDTQTARLDESENTKTKM